MQIKIGKIYKCGNRYVKIICCTDIMFYGYIGIECNIIPGDDPITNPFVGAFCYNGQNSTSNPKQLSHPLAYIQPEIRIGSIITSKLKCDDSNEIEKKFLIINEVGSGEFRFIGVELKNDDEVKENPFLILFDKHGNFDK